MGRLQEIRVVDPVLTQLAWGYKNAAMVADALFPRVFVDKEGGKIPVFGKEAFREYVTLRALRANSNMMPVDSRSTIDIILDEHDLGYPLDRREGQESTFDEQKIGQKIVLDAMLLQREIRAASLAFNAGNYDATNKLTLTSTAQFTHASSLPIATIETGKAAIAADIGMEPNVLVMGKTVYNVLSQHATLLERIKYSQLGVVTIDLMKTIFGIPNIFVGSAIKFSDDGVQSYVWNDSLLLAYVAIASESTAEPSYGYTPTKRGYPQSDVYTLPGGKVDVIRNTDILKEKIVGADAGYLLSDCNA